jgi:phosphate/sulfate permease
MKVAALLVAPIAGIIAAFFFFYAARSYQADKGKVLQVHLVRE